MANNFPRKIFGHKLFVLFFNNADMDEPKEKNDTKKEENMEESGDSDSDKDDVDHLIWDTGTCGAHEFEETHFNKLTYCEYCGSLIAALEWKQGSQCRVCSFTAHKKCASKVGDTCPISVPLENANGNDIPLKEKFKTGEHSFCEQYFSRPTYCNVCRNLLYGIVGKQGYSCYICKFVAHRKCVDKAPSNCPITKFDTEQKQTAFRHYWIEGNLEGDCCKCKCSVTSFQCLYGFRCYWCGQQVTLTFFCNACKETVAEQTCDMGPLRRLKIPPTGFITNGTDDISQWTVKVPEGGSPVLVFINKKSGGQQGVYVYQQFCALLNPHQIVDLSKGGPAPGLKMFRNVKDYKVLACGGDGTVAWVLHVIDNLQLEYAPPVAPLPLGTANDCARFLGWGGGYNGESIEEILKELEKSKPRLVDRWMLNITEKDPTTGEFTEIKPHKIVNNYFSIGIDAKVALAFHRKREKTPKKFKSRTINKLWYLKFGADALLDGCEGLPTQIAIEVDGQELKLPSDLQGVMFTNLPSYMGGTDLWGSKSSKEEKKKPSVDDKLIEIVGVKNSFHLGQIKAGTSNAIRLAQAGHVKIAIKTDTPLPVQVDGEPWEQAPAVLQITHHTQSKLLAKSDK
jgi:diacylglycerol kinase (ATP)